MKIKVVRVTAGTNCTQKKNVAYTNFRCTSANNNSICVYGVEFCRFQTRPQTSVCTWSYAL